MSADDRVDILNLRMLRTVRGEGYLRDSAHFKAFQLVPRHAFVPVVYTEEGATLRALRVNRDDPSPEVLEKIYLDEPVAVAAADNRVTSTSSQPTVMAMMMELSGIGSGSRVLEIGTGSGYNAAVLAKVVGDPERVVSVESNAEVCAMARESLRRVGLDGVRVYQDEGGFGQAAHAPYDAIIVTCACTDIPFFWHEQLAEGGTLVLPLATRGVEAVAALKKRGASFTGSFHCYVSFMCMTGAPSMITHYHFDAHNFGALRVILAASQEVEGLFADELRRETEGRYGLLDLAFFMAVADERTVAFEDDRPEGSIEAYGLWSREAREKGFAFALKDGRILSYGDEEVLAALEALFRKYIALGKPKLADYAIAAMPSTHAPVVGVDQWSVKRTHCHTLFSLRRRAPFV